MVYTINQDEISKLIVWAG